MRFDADFDKIVAAALAGERCPTNDKLNVGATSALCRQGRTRALVYPVNYRVVQILTGPHAGQSTKAPPNPDWVPYKIVDASAPRLKGFKRPDPRPHARTKQSS